MTLVEKGRLRLDDKVMPFLDDLPPAKGARVDPRWDSITIRQLLNHSGGWNREKSDDPMFKTEDATRIFEKNERPASVESIIRYMKGRPLDFDPGTSHAYSNFGYALLGHVIERITGESYEEYVQHAVLEPAGIRGMAQGHTRFTERLPGEVKYYAPNKPLMYPMVASVYPGEAEVPRAYGGFYLEAMAAHGGWVSSAIDLLRFINVVDRRPGTPDILTRASIDSMLAHDEKAYPAREVWYGLGWGVRPAGGDYNYWHDGSLPGATSLLVRAFNNTSWAVLFNGGDSGNFMRDLDSGMWTALRGVTAWPDVDLFRKFP
jgi:N-acyl-D-amino-acid deacylase